MRRASRRRPGASRVRALCRCRAEWRALSPPGRSAAFRKRVREAAHPVVPVIAPRLEVVVKAAAQGKVLDGRWPAERARLDVVDLDPLRRAADPAGMERVLAAPAVARPHLAQDLGRNVVRLRRPPLRLRLGDEPLPLACWARTRSR